jgi:guanylate kinase
VSRDGADRRGPLIVIAAPSGAGKTTLVRALLERSPEVRFSISYTTRQPRPRERHGADYFFVSEAEFERMVRAGEFLEHARVFDHWYGTSKAYVDTLRDAGHPVLLEIDWQGAAQVRRVAPDARTIFIVPPDVAELERRLRGRGTDSEAVIRRRLQDSLSDLRHWNEFDYIVVNDVLEVAADEFAAIVAGRGAASARSRPEVRERVLRILAASR